MDRQLRPKLVFFGDPQKDTVREVIGEFTRFLGDRVTILADFTQQTCQPEILASCDFAIVFGGDGSIIAAARDLSTCQVPVIGVNLGKLGYLAEFNLRELKDQFDQIVSGRNSIELRMMLRCQVTHNRPGQTQDRSDILAVNDIFITAGPPFRVIELQIRVDGYYVAQCISDGLIVSTPTGSTAYNLSAGGPILNGAMEAVVITPICPHSLSFRPIVIPSGCCIEIEGVRVNDGTTVSMDGQVSRNLCQGQIVNITQARQRFRIVNNPLRNHWQTLATKLGWARPPSYHEP